MGILSKNYLRFNKDDVEMMKNMMKQFHEYHEGTGLPDFSKNYVAYLPVFAIALLASQKSVDKLARTLVWLTVVITTLTVMLTAMTLVMVIRVI